MKAAGIPGTLAGPRVPWMAQSLHIERWDPEAPYSVLAKLAGHTNVAESVIAAALVEESIKTNIYIEQSMMSKRWVSSINELYSGGMLPCGFLWMFLVY